MQEKIRKLIELKAQASELENEIKSIQKSLLDDGLQKESVDGYSVFRTVRQTPKLKEGADAGELAMYFPEYMKFDVTQFAKDPKSEEYIEFSISEYLTVKGKK